MPSVRSFILLAVLIVFLSVTIGFLTMLRPPDSGGRAADTYGTQAHGYRALFETLTELEVPVRRQLAPPTRQTPVDHTLVLLAPERNLVGTEPAYLQALNDWVERGGRLVITASPAEHHNPMAPPPDDAPRPDILEVLNLDTVSITDDRAPLSEHTSGKGQARTAQAPSEPIDRITERILSGLGNRTRPVRRVAVQASGSLSGLDRLVESLSVPAGVVRRVNTTTEQPAGRVSDTDAGEHDHHLVAQFVRGRGSITVIADPALLTNQLIAQTDNSVLAAHLLSPDRRPVIFDEFYHGLAVRGNPLYLLTRPGYAAVAVAVLLAVGVRTWREAVFPGPPLADTESNRRDISEYIDAMGRFFHQSRTGRPFLLREVRDGVLHHVCREVGLPPQTPNLDTIVATLARRDPVRAKRLQKVVAEVDGSLTTAQDNSDSQTIQYMRRLTDCLSKNATRPSAGKSPKSSSGRMRLSILLWPLCTAAVMSCWKAHQA